MEAPCECTIAIEIFLSHHDGVQQESACGGLPVPDLPMGQKDVPPWVFYGRKGSEEEDTSKRVKKSKRKKWGKGNVEPIQADLMD
ncbi:hypothetical protein llap_3768 [Limosa lapponica baueri]|uniref:Uncharacterized protein n=1 Tax=Limosa lapponica baueri TaxID=1758121 RepID=A0A2I0UIP6_LIMLA|nr:hypothetical protein llap_3768 [Limosa lapponica baueri]